MTDLNITDSHGWLVEIIRAAVSWIYSRQKTDAFMVRLTIKDSKASGFYAFNGVFAVGLGMAGVKNKAL